MLSGAVGSVGGAAGAMGWKAIRRGVRPGGRFQAARAQPRRLRREDEDILQLFAWSFHFYRYLCVEREQQTVVESADCNEHRALFPERAMMLFSI